jgi:hypothetical protein
MRGVGWYEGGWVVFHLKICSPRPQWCCHISPTTTVALPPRGSTLIVGHFMMRLNVCPREVMAWAGLWEWGCGGTQVQAGWGARGEGCTGLLSVGQGLAERAWWTGSMASTSLPAHTPVC